MFKVGDRVVAVRDINDGVVFENESGTIEVINQCYDLDIGVVWDIQSSRKHSLDDLCVNRGWWVSSKDLKLLKPNDKTITIPEVLETISSLNIPEDIYKIINNKFMEMV